MSPKRCAWVREDDTHCLHYHDKEWGVPLYDDQLLFELLILEGAQAGLSWITILKRREGYRQAFDQFDPKKVARYSPQKIEKLLANPDIIRNRLKIEAAVINAKCYLAVQKEFGSFANYLWQFVRGQPIQNRWTHQKEVPAVTDLAKDIAKDLKKRGFKFVGPTIMYAFMQAVGMVNDHLTECFRHKEILDRIHSKR